MPDKAALLIVGVGGWPWVRSLTHWPEAMIHSPTDELMPLAETLLEVPQHLIQTALELELQEGTVIAVSSGLLARALA